MSARQLKAGYFIIEGLNSFATVFYLYYLYFFLQRVYGFGNTANLTLAALNGLIYMVGSIWGGRFAQRHGYFFALKLGFATMMVALTGGLFVRTAAGHIVVMAGMILGMCLTWPTLEALVSEGESPAGMQHMIGIYNVVWACTAAFGNFTGGAMLEHLGLKSLFYVPIAMQLVQLGTTVWLEQQAKKTAVPAASHEESKGLKNPTPSPLLVEPNPRPIAKARMFLRLAWLANPFAYVAIQTLIAVVPGVAHRLALSATQAGFCCSVWSFARLGAFFGLWYWAGWHYRFRWLLVSYLALIVTFTTILLAPNVGLLVSAQIVFGGALGLIYYSSLFYSMDLSEAKSEHGGIHEAAIGLGNFVGPAIGAGALHLLPNSPNSGAVAVSVVLVLGLGGLLAIRAVHGRTR